MWIPWLQHIELHRARGVLLSQAVLTAVIALLALGGGRNMALSALAGGMVATIANLVFAIIVFSGYRAQQPDKLVNRLYAAELIKLLVIAGTFAAVFAWLRPVGVLVLLGGFLLVQVVPPMLSRRG